MLIWKRLCFIFIFERLFSQNYKDDVLLPSGMHCFFIRSQPYPYFCSPLLSFGCFNILILSFVFSNFILLNFIFSNLILVGLDVVFFGVTMLGTHWNSGICRLISFFIKFGEISWNMFLPHLSSTTLTTHLLDYLILSITCH